MCDARHPNNRAYFSCAVSRLQRVSQPGQAAAILRKAIGNSSEWDAAHRRGNHAQALALTGKHDDAAAELTSLAEWFGDRSPFHEALAWLRTGVALLPAGVRLSALPASRRREAYRAFARGWEVTVSAKGPHAPGLSLGAAHNLARLAISLDLDGTDWRRQCTLHDLAGDTTVRTPHPGPIIGHRAGMPRELLRHPGALSMVPSLTEQGMPASNLAVLNWY